MTAHVSVAEAERFPVFGWDGKSKSGQDRSSPHGWSPESEFNLKQLKVEWLAHTGTLWTRMAYRGRPSYNPDMLLDFVEWQDTIQATFRSRPSDLRFLVLASDFPGVFSLGGDLALFANRIRERDRAALVTYGRTCTAILYRNLCALDLPVITIGLVEGDALGGGLESLLSFNVVIAEKGARFGLPETLFGLFPGMGAHCLLTRRLGAAKANDMILSGRLYTAEEMHALGLVHVLAEPGLGRAAAQDYIRQASRRHAGHLANYKAARQVMAVTQAELDAIVEIWADASLCLREQDLKVMERLVAAQMRLHQACEQH